MSTAAFNQTYKKVSQMGENLKKSGGQGPSNDEQLKVRVLALLPTKNLSPQPTTPKKPSCSCHRYKRRKLDPYVYQEKYPS
jgi:hypothetical protein